MPQLSEAEKQSYADNGYVVPKYRIPDKALNKLREALDQTIANNPEVRPEQLAAVHTPKLRDDDTTGHQAFLDFALEPTLVELVSGVLGGNIIMWGSQIFCKPADDGMEVPMHQDGQYWPIRPLATCTVWLALDGATRENGCLKVLAGSHAKQEHYKHRFDDREDLVLNQALDDERAEDYETHHIELEPGQLSLHDIYLVHGSEPNRSGKRRAGLTVRFMPSTSWFRRDLEIPFAGYPVNWKTRPIWLARGRDVSGHNDFTTGHDFTTASDCTGQGAF